MDKIPPLDPKPAHLTDPSEIMDAGERARLLYEWTKSRRPYTYIYGRRDPYDPSRKLVDVRYLVLRLLRDHELLCQTRDETIDSDAHHEAELDNLQEQVDALQSAAGTLKDRVRELLSDLENRNDVVDGVDGPRPNEAMQLLNDHGRGLNRAISELEALL